MARSGWRARTSRIVLLACLLAASAACTTEPQAPAVGGTARQPRTAFDSGIELPDGAGREILVTACLNCHELTALALFSDFYGRDNWRSLIVSMQANGAEVDGQAIDVLADYLAEHFGTGAP